MKFAINSKIALLTIIAGLFASCQTSQEQEQYDLVLSNGRIWTGDENQPWAKWVAINGESIVLVGNDDNPPPSEEEMNLDGQLTVPGFNDSHVHFASAGHLLLGINLLDVNEDDLLIQRIRETMDRLPVGSWITRGDWGAYEAWNLGSEGGDTKSAAWEPNRSMIDSISSDYPVLVTKYDRQQGLANAAALDFLGLESETGLLTGQILEAALSEIPDKTFDRKLSEARRALEECRKWGVTTVQDMSPLDQVDIYNHLKDNDELTTRINFSPSRLSEYQNMIEKGWVIDYSNPGNPQTAGNDWISFGTLKTHIDGIMGGRTARFYEPYEDNKVENPTWRGGWREFSQDMPSFKQMILEADANNIQMRIHAIGDEANAILLDILDSMHLVNGNKDRRFRLVHAQVISDRDFGRFNGMNVVAEVQPYHVTDDMRWMEERIGYERCKGAYAFKTLEENNCLLSFGSDWPGTNASYYPINPFYGLYAAVTRQTVNGEPEAGWFPEQRISLEEALKAYTYGSSYGAFEDDKKGTIEPGKLADIAVLNTDLFVTEPSDWLNAKISHTIVGGKIVYSGD